jgi:hypothetical protein
MWKLKKTSWASILIKKITFMRWIMNKKILEKIRCFLVWR